MWDASDILDERPTTYLIKWKGKNPNTGNPWMNTWEEKSGCTEPLVAAWEARNSKDTGQKARGAEDIINFIISQCHILITVAVRQRTSRTDAPDPPLRARSSIRLSTKPRPEFQDTATISTREKPITESETGPPKKKFKIEEPRYPKVLA